MIPEAAVEENGRVTITEFLEARIAEDEADAKAADGGRWLPEDKGVSFEFYGDEFPGGEAQARLVADTRANMNHIANYSPARVLAECAAKRAIIEQSGNYSPELEHGDNGEWAFDVTLRALVSAYADHPDYQQEWAL